MHNYHSKSTSISPGITLVPPLSRRGTGPGLLLLVPDSVDSLAINDGVPSALLKWAEEGYAVVEIKESALGGGEVLARALRALDECGECEGSDVGIIAYTPSAWNLVDDELAVTPRVIVAVIYTTSTTTLSPSPVPILQHIASDVPQPIRSKDITQHTYPLTKSHLFATPSSPDFHYASESVSHTRTLSFIKPRLGGPYFDLEAIWEEHTKYEFAERDVDKTMATMVAEPYVNHIPTITGGIGRQDLTSFYAKHFIFSNPPDTALELISRTVGIDRVIDEFVFSFTHDTEIPWLIPGIPPTYEKVAVPFTAVVNVRGDRLYHEHIAWDQGSVLRQLGLLPEWLPWPYAAPGESEPSKHNEPSQTTEKTNGTNVTNSINGIHSPALRRSKTGWEYRVPVAGRETAMKMQDKNAVPSNVLMGAR